MMKPSISAHGSSRRRKFCGLLLILSFAAAPAEGAAIDEQVSHGYIDNAGVSLHYVTSGAGPLVVLLHGFPDFWFTWRNIMPALSENHQVVALDLRGYNLSDKPKGVENYTMSMLISDVVALIRNQGTAPAIVIGHDWGGAIAWQVAINHPDLVEKLIVLSTPHPAGLSRELASNSDQIQSSQYALDFQSETAAAITQEFYSDWVRDPADRMRYEEAYRNSDVEAMLNYYRASFPRVGSGASSQRPSASSGRQVGVPTLAIFGVDDRQLLPAGFNNTWNYMDAELTLVAVPHAGHFVQHDAPDVVLRTLLAWLGK